MNDDQPQINEAWLRWMRDFRMAAAKLADVDSFDAPEGEEPELLFVKFALFARALTLFDTALMLAEHDKVLDAQYLPQGRGMRDPYGRGVPQAGLSASAQG